MLRFHTLDVFTRTPHSGNPLAVVGGGQDLSTAAMQAIAREFNVSETVFLLPPEQGGDARVRIFTPMQELPFAGHPTIGTAVLLAQLGITDDGQNDIVLEEGVGPVKVHLRRDGDAWFAELQAFGQPETRKPEFRAGAIAKAIGTTAKQITQLQLASCGVPFAIATLSQPELLAGLSVDASALKAALHGSWGHALYVVAKGYEGEWRARMFAPDLGVLEDPATGAAAAAFAGALALADARADCEEAFTLLQGVEMGRPSELKLRYSRVAGAVAGVFVGGHAVRMSEGTLVALPDGKS